MPCHRTDTTSTAAASIPAFAAPRAEGLLGAPHGISQVALGAAATGSDRSPLGGQGPLSRLTRHGVQSEQPRHRNLSADTFSGHAYAKPSRAEQIGACICIVLALATPLALMFVGALS